MPMQVFSRDFLQSLPEQRKQEQIDKIIDSFIQNMLEIASSGEKTFHWTRNYLPPSGLVAYSSNLTDAEIIAGFFTRFPGCKIYYEETWVETQPNTRNLKKGIVIDWS